MRRSKNSSGSSGFAKPRLRGSRVIQYSVLAFLASFVASAISVSDAPWNRFLNSKGVDAYFRWRGAKTPGEVMALPQSTEIIIVELQHEVPRRLLAQLVKHLSMAKVVGIDLMFSDREKELTQAERPLYQGEIGRWRQENSQFAAAVKSANNVVIGSWPDRTYVEVAGPTGGKQIEVSWRHAVPAIEKAARWRGHLNVVPDAQVDGLIRRVVLWQAPETFGMPALSASQTTALPAFGLCVAAAARETTTKAMSSRTALVGPQEMLIDYLGERNTFEAKNNHLTYQEALGRAPEDFADQIVLIGETSYGSKDTFPTPYGDMPGLYIHANIAATLMSDQGAPGPLPFVAIVAITFVLSFILLIPLLRQKPVLMCLPLALVEIVFAFGVMFTIWTNSHSILPMSAPIFALFLTYNSVAVYESVRTRNVLKSLIGKKGVSKMLDALDKLELGGTSEVATAFFCDLRGYTSLAQHLPADSLLLLLNMYTDAVVKEIMRFDGRPIDYFGDGVFAIFEGPDHAARALRAALSAPEAVRVRFLELEPLVEKRPELKSTSDTPPQMGIAISTGPMIIGFVGSLQRPKPGAVGDTVNVASRVQGLTSVCGMSVLMTRATLDALGNWDEREGKIRPCGIHEVKGRDEPIEVFGAEIPV